MPFLPELPEFRISLLSSLLVLMGFVELEVVSAFSTLSLLVGAQCSR